MPCLGCANNDDDVKGSKLSTHSMFLSESVSHHRRPDSAKLHVMEELSQNTYGLELEGQENKRYEAQDFFAFKEIVGSGALAVVFRAYFKPTGNVYAVKFVPNFTHSRHFVSRDLTVLQLSVHCKYIVRYHSHFRVGPNMYIVMEICEGGTLQELLGQKYLMPPCLGRTYLKELSSALMFLHSLKFVHRDVHMGNCLLTSTAHLRLTDFGLTRSVEDPSGEMMTACGKAAIRAPEMYLYKLCGFGLDWWSMGVLLYRFMTGYYPFQTEKLTQGFQSVTKLKEKYPDWLFEDPTITDFCQKLLAKDPRQRIGYNNEDEVKFHPYFSDMNWSDDEPIESVIEHDIRLGLKRYTPVLRKILVILRISNHPLLGMKDSEVSMSRPANLEDASPQNIAKKLTNFLALSSEEKTQRVSQRQYLRGFSETVV